MRALATIFCRPGSVQLFITMIALVPVVILETQFAPVSHASSGGFQFGMVPSLVKPYDVTPRGYFTYDSIPGARIVDSIHVTNNGSVRGSIHFYISDATTSATSGTTFLPENAPRRDVGAWIRLSRRQVALDPGQSQEVPFTLTIPKHVRPGQHGGVIIAEQMETSYVKRSVKQASVAIGIKNSLGLGVLVNLPGPTVERLNAQDISYDGKSQYQRLIIALENTGTQLLYPQGYLRVFDMQGIAVQNLKLKLRTFVPQTSINYPADIQYKPLSPGKRYIANLYLSYGEGHILMYKTSFLVPLSSKNPVVKFFQNIGAPVATPSENIFSQLISQSSIIGISMFFLIASSLFFWGQKILKVLCNLWNKKRRL